MTTTRVILILVSPLFLATACGGGGSGSGSGGNTPPPPSAGLGITPSNGAQVAGVAYQAALASGDIASLASNSGLTGSAGGGLAAASPEAQAGRQGSTVLQNVPVGPTTSPCAVSGSITISGDLANPLTLTAGDTISASYDNCDDGAGEVVDGDMDFEVDAFSGDILSGAYDMTMTMNITDFQVSSATDVITGNGDGTATINTLAAPYVEASVSGNSMTTDTNSFSQTLYNYVSAQTVDSGVSPSPYTYMSSGTLDTTRLGGVIDYTTTVIFEGFDADYPYVGELLVVGDNSSARLIAQPNSIDVVIEIYDNTTGTGTPVDVINTTWADLASM